VGIKSAIACQVAREQEVKSIKHTPKTARVRPTNRAANLLNAVFHNEAEHVNGLGLPDAMSSVHGLLRANEID
jgi:hypothetical protein